MASKETLPLTRAECSGFDELTINIHTINKWLENVNINEHRRQSDKLIASLRQDIPQGRLGAGRPDYAESDGHDTATTDDAESDEEEKLEQEKTILIDDEDAEEDESTSDFEDDNVNSDDASITGSEMSGEAMDIEEDVRNLFDTSTSKSNLMSTRRRVDEDERENGGDNVESDEDVVSEYENSDEDEGDDEGEDEGDDEDDDKYDDGDDYGDDDGDGDGDGDEDEDNESKGDGTTLPACNKRSHNEEIEDNDETMVSSPRKKHRRG